MTVALIWAQATGRVVGKDNTIPWRVPEDQQRFKKLTTGHRVVMGRGTWESLPQSVRPLPERDNVVLSRNADYEAAGARVVSTLDAALADVPDDDTVFVIGGAAIWAAALPLARDLYVTDVDLEIEGADTFAPQLSGSVWRAEQIGVWQKSGSLRYRFVHYQRR